MAERSQPPQIDVYRVTVDYTQSLADMVKAGAYDDADEAIRAEHFSLKGTGIVEREVMLVHFNRYIESEDAVREMERLGLEPAPIEDLLALGAAYPHLQRQSVIVGLGSSWVGPHGARVPVLSRLGSGRGLGLAWLAGGWRERYRFLARRKK